MTKALPLPSPAGLCNNRYMSGTLPGTQFNNPPGIIPALVPPDPYWVSNTPYDAMVGQFGTRVLWEKAHACPCQWTQPVKGSPLPSCHTCSGLGWYWDKPIGPFPVMLTYAHSPLAADEPGTIINDRFGQIMSADPLLVLAYGANSGVWAEASEYDRYTEVDAYWRFYATLYEGQKMLLPFTQGISVEAVTYFNQATSSVSAVASYGVTGNSVSANNLPYGQAYVVEFYANPQFVAQKRAGSLPHVRPFVQGTIPLPKRFKLMQLDYWLRTQGNY